MIDKVIQIFEKSAQEYDAWFDRNQIAYESEILALKRFLIPGGRSLEVGVGTGRFAIPLGIDLGVEPAQAMAEIARKRGVKICQARAESLPFVAAAFDLVLMVTVLCFLSDPFRALAEAARVLKPQGRILIGMIDGDSPLGRQYEASKQESRFYAQARFYPAQQVIGWLEGLAFKNFQVCQTIFKPLKEITALEPVKPGFGEGGFVAINAQKGEETIL